MHSVYQNMDKFMCKRCGYSTNHKCDLVKHLKKKYTCDPILDTMNREDLLHEVWKPREKRHIHACNDKKVLQEMRENLDSIVGMVQSMHRCMISKSTI